MDLTDQFSADLTPSVTDSDLGQISALAEQQLHYKQLITTLEADLAEVKVKLRDVAERALPEAMASIGMEEFKMSNGYRVSINKGVAASMKADKTLEACSWLEGLGLGDVVKDEIRVLLGRGEMEMSHEFLLLAEKLGVGATEKLAVHPQTLNALVKEQMEQGVEFPPDLFSVYSYSKAKVEPYKEKVKKVKGVKIPEASAAQVPSGPLTYEEF
jgi:hypothetical protein